MKRCSLWIIVCASALLFLNAHAAKASIYNILLSEHKPIELISQRLSLEAIQNAEPSQDYYIEFLTIGENNFSIQVLPRDRTVTYRLIDERPLPERRLLVNSATKQSLPVESVSADKTSYRIDQNFLSFEDGVNDEIVATLLAQKVNQVFSSDRFFSVTTAKLSVKSNTDLHIRKLEEPLTATGLIQASPVYQFDILEKEKLDPAIPLSLKIQYNNTDQASRSLYYFDGNKNAWLRLPSYNNLDTKTVEASIHLLFARVAIFIDPVKNDGIASWYAYKGCLCGASTKYPKGSLVKVTRLKTGASVIIKINDYGPEARTHRVIDLDKKAFLKLGKLSAGLIYVSVEPYDNP